jgi:hypothetical protein
MKRRSKLMSKDTYFKKFFRKKKNSAFPFFFPSAVILAAYFIFIPFCAESDGDNSGKSGGSGSQSSSADCRRYASSFSDDSALSINYNCNFSVLNKSLECSDTLQNKKTYYYDSVSEFVDEGDHYFSILKTSEEYASSGLTSLFLYNNEVYTSSSSSTLSLFNTGIYSTSTSSTTYFYKYTDDKKVSYYLGNNGSIFQTAEWDDDMRITKALLNDNNCINADITYTYDDTNYSRDLLISGGESNCGNYRLTTTLNKKGYLVKNVWTFINTATNTINYSVHSEGKVCKNYTADDDTDTGEAESGTLTINLDLTSSTVNDSANVQIKAFLGASLLASSSTDAELNSGTNPIAKKAEVKLQSVDGDGIPTGTDATLTAGTYELFVQVDSNDNSTYEQSEPAFTSFIAIDGNKTYSFSADDFTDSLVSVQTVINSGVTALQDKVIMCYWIKPGGVYSNISQVFAQNISGSTFDALGSVTTAADVPLIPEAYDIYCEVDVDGSGQLDSGEYFVNRGSILVTEPAVQPLSIALELEEVP